jgi:hypothetical protein
MNRVHLIIIHPCPLTKHLGFIKQNHLSHSTATSLLTSEWLGLVGYGHATKWQPRVLVCIFLGILACEGVNNPWPNYNGRAKSDWFVQSKNQPYQNQRLGGLLGYELAVGWKGSSVCDNKE